MTFIVKLIEKKKMSINIGHAEKESNQFSLIENIVLSYVYINKLIKMKSINLL